MVACNTRSFNLHFAPKSYVPSVFSPKDNYTTLNIYLPVICESREYRRRLSVSPPSLEVVDGGGPAAANGRFLLSNAAGNDVPAFWRGPRPSSIVQQICPAEQSFEYATDTHTRRIPAATSSFFP